MPRCCYLSPFAPFLRTAFLATVLMCGSASLASAQAPADSLKALQLRIERLEHELDAIRAAAPPAPLVTPPVAKPSGREAGLTVGGLVQVQGEFRDRGDARFTSNNDRFYLRRARLNATGYFLEDYEFRIEAELAGSIAEGSAVRGQLTDAYISWIRFPAAVVRFGQFKAPFGFEQLYLDSRLPGMERSVPNDRLTLSRQTGVQLGGDLLAKRATYAASIFNGTGANNTFNDNKQFLYVARLTATPWLTTPQNGRWSLGANGFDTQDAALPGQPSEFGFDSTPGDNKADNVFVGQRRGFGADTQFRLGRAELWIEFLSEHFRPRNRVPMTRFDSRGGYAQGTFFFVPARFQGLVRFEVYDPNRSAARDRTNNWLFGLNDFIKGDDVRVQVNYERTVYEKRLTATPKSQNKLLARIQTIF